MSEQKMPEPMESAWDLVARERRAAYDEGFAAGRQQERERLEPLRAVLADLDQVDGMMYFAGLQYLVDTARTLLEQTE